MSKSSSIVYHKNNFMKYRFLLKELVSKNIKLQYRDSFLGMFWTFLQPLLTMIVLTIVFGTLFGRDSKEVVNYPVYLLCGKLLFDFFSNSTKRAMRSIRGHAGIIKKVYVPKYIYPLSDIISTFVTFLISLIVLVVVIIFFNIIGYHPFHVTWRVVYAVIPLINLFLLALGVGMILSTLSVFFRDVENIYDVFALLLFYVTPIMYHINKLGLEPGSWQMKIVKLNPLYGIIGNFRAAILWGNDFVHYWDMNLMYLDIAITAFCLVVGFAMFYKNQDKFILHI
ncbi:MAG: ABC transporter permease [Faecalibacterium sp.]|nr:ABC transporter permease [Ruminococcus sp.]MCM1392612.1 ABC transporter permease [Ruminococcus sp.]MCM1486432.1 ABC transporter permease [Faecalibacterium sp.]